MAVTIQSIHFTASDDLLGFVNGKVNKLNVFYHLLGNMVTKQLLYL